MKKFGVLTVVAALFAWVGARADQPATHGMLLFGGNVVYASHLPMFHSPHDYQLLMKLKLEDAPLSFTLMKYNTAKRSSATYFTLVPEPMDLAKVVDGTLKTFTAIIFEGHFERGGKRIGPVQVTVAELLYAQKLDGSREPSDNRYMIFGEKGEYFAAHLIDGRPNFDAIARTAQPYKLTNGSCRSRACIGPEKRPVEDERLPLEIAAGHPSKPPQSGDVLGEVGGVIADIKKMIYVEVDELSLD